MLVGEYKPGVANDWQNNWKTFTNAQHYKKATSSPTSALTSLEPRMVTTYPNNAQLETLTTHVLNTSSTI
jgi:hypothetical protein